MLHVYRNKKPQKELKITAAELQSAQEYEVPLSSPQLSTSFDNHVYSEVKRHETPKEEYKMVKNVLYNVSMPQKSGTKTSRYANVPPSCFQLSIT